MSNILVGLLAGFTIGIAFSSHFDRQVIDELQAEAVKRGVAEWNYIPPKIKPQFQWKPAN